MKIEIVHISRRPPWPLWAVLLVFVWLGFGTLAILLGAYLNRPVQLCLLKHLTGFACPTCGFTRGALSLMHGQLVKAWLCNPLLYSVLGLFFFDAVVRVIFGRDVRISLKSTERSIAWILALILFLVNWAYVIVYIG